MKPPFHRDRLKKKRMKANPVQDRLSSLSPTAETDEANRVEQAFQPVSHGGNG